MARVDVAGSFTHRRLAATRVFRAGLRALGGAWIDVDVRLRDHHGGPGAGVRPCSRHPGLFASDGHRRRHAGHVQRGDGDVAGLAVGALHPGDRTVVFGVGLAGGADITFPDGSAFAIGIPGASSLKGGPKGDGLAGSGLSDLLDGAGGDDVLGGGDGADSLVGGDGSDLFIVEAGDSPATLGQMDVVLDWSPQDRLSFLRPAGSATTYIEATASSFAAAKSLADAQIAIGSVDYVAVQVGSDVIVFATARATTWSRTTRSLFARGHSTQSTRRTSSRP